LHLNRDPFSTPFLSSLDSAATSGWLYVVAFAEEGATAAAAAAAAEEAAERENREE